MRTADHFKTRVAAHLANHGKVSAKQTAKFIGVSESCAAKYLRILCGENLAHRTFGPILSTGARHVFFNAGLAPEGAKNAFDSRATVKRWEPQRVVDPWMLPRPFFGGVAA